EKLRHTHLGERPDDLVHVATGGEVAALAAQHHHLDARLVRKRAKMIAQLGVRIERQRVFPLGPIQRNHADLALDAPQKMLGLLHGATSSACSLARASSRKSSSCSRRDRPESISTTHSSCARAISAKVRSPALVRRMRKARRSLGSSSRSTMPSFSS